jgi:CO/xanthine dehydrogenase FAD-binding subunit
MKNFILQTALSVDEALQFLKDASGTAKVIAGGTDLIVGLRDESLEEEKAKTVLDISRIKELKTIAMNDETIRIGALTTHAEIAESSLILKYASILAEACSKVGGPQIRNRGTIGGNIINASPAADSIPALVALDAKLLIQGPTGTKEISIVEFITGPYMTTIATDELLVSISFKRVLENSKHVFVKVGRREALSISRMNLALISHTDKAGKIDDIRFSVGSVTPRPRRIGEIEKIFLGKEPVEDMCIQAKTMIQDIMVKESGIRKSTVYKKPVIGDLTYSALHGIL